MKMYLQALTDHVQQLLDCDQVSLFLYCPVIAVRHPLLPLFYELHKHSPLCYGSFCDPALLYNERLWAIGDSVLQRGQYIIDGVQLCSIGVEAPANSIIALLERPAGIIGFLFCVTQPEDTFTEGERQLLTHYLPTVAYQIEQVVSESCAGLPKVLDEENKRREAQEQHIFLSLVGHELRAPLMTIKGYAGILKEYGLEQGGHAKISQVQQQRYLESIMEKIKHLEVLIGDMLDISHIQSGRLTLHYSYVDLTLLCQDAVQLLRHRIEQQQLGHYCITCNITPGLPLVWVDADRVQQILTNLLENALKYSPAGGLIEVHVCMPENCFLNCPCVSSEVQSSRKEDETIFVCVTVSDQGIGIPRERHSTLFKPFVRLEHPATRHITGNGLGLYIVRKLVEAMHGRVLLRSSEGKGTSITCMLPTVVTSRKGVEDVRFVRFQG